MSKTKVEKKTTEESVKVVVRVRPFNKRETDRNAKCCVEMSGNQTSITDPSDPDGTPKSFGFDYSYWSHDGGRERADGYWEPDSSHTNSSKYCDQAKVFADLGEGLLKNAWDGYNSTLFAYGQTGSGKSYSVVGYGINKGIVPLFCEKLFADIEQKRAKKGDGVSFEVSFSMLEIYNEIVRDLLNSKGDKKKGLRVRQHPKKGFWAEGLTVVPVDSYATIKAKMDEGTTNRTIAATNMNETSSRAHTIVGITFVQKRKNTAGQEVAKTSVNNLVDLAGSERVASTGATGDRLKEGAAINQSLSSLGNCISALADQSQGKKTKVPYRDSSLTKLLMNALGGNSKTIMIAAISPADINFEESLSTLRYADRAKQIKTKVSVNEDPTEALIRDLQDENSRLQAALAKSGGGGGGGGAVDDADAENYKAQLEQNEREMAEMRKSFDEKLKQAEGGQSGAVRNQEEIERQRAKIPHLFNLNMDPQLSGSIIYFLNATKYRVGNQKGRKSDIVLMGPSILERHAVIQASKDFSSIMLEKADNKARVLVNGAPIAAKTELHHHDRIMFGTTQLYVFANPHEAKQQPRENWPQVGWDMAQDEIANESGFDMSRGAKSDAELQLQEQLVDLMPAVEQANAISQSLDKMVKFELLVVSAEALGKPGDSQEAFVRVRNFANGLQYDWPKDKFMNRCFKMQELYEDVEAGEVSMRDLPDEQDPFTEPIHEPVRFGACSIFLKSLGYLIDFKSQLAITDYRGNEVGLLNIMVAPCDGKGQELTDQSDTWVDNPKDLLNRDMHFVMKIKDARGLPPRFTDVECRYKFYGHEDYTKTQTMADTSNPDFNHVEHFSFRPVTMNALEYILEGRILVELWGVQMPIQHSGRDKRNTGAMMAAESLSKGMISASNSNQKVVDMGRVKADMESAVLRRRQETVEAKFGILREMIKQGEMRDKHVMPLNFVKGVLDAPSPDVLQKWADLYESYQPNGIKGASNSHSSDNRISSKSSACVIT